ncbi:MAG: hypothetical protein WHS87_02310 [Anaerolineales bacterium]
MGKRSIPIWLITAFVLFGITLIWVAMVMAYWPAENSLRIREMHRLEGCLFQIVKPNIVPVDEPVDLEITLQDSRNCTLPVTLVLQVPPTFVILEPPSDKTGRVMLSFSAEGQTQRLRLENTRLVRWFKADEKIKLVKDEMASASDADNIPIAIEGVLRAKLLQSGKEFPIFPIVTLFFSLAAFYLQYKQQEIKEHERREAANRAGNLWEQTRQAIRSGDIRLAKNILKSIREENLSTYLEKPGEIEIVDRLLRLAEGEFRSWTEPFPPHGWTSEAAAALIYAARHYPTDRSISLNLFRTFPQHDLDAEQRRTFQEIHRELSNALIVERRWPLLPTVIRQSEKPDLSTIFPAVAQGEKEETVLFSEQRGMFYPGHPVYSQIQSTREICLVVGEAGSGRTALCLALGRYHILDDAPIYSFGCYLPYAAQTNLLRQALAARLLEFIEANPSQLINLEDPQRQLLARFLGTSLGITVVRAKLSEKLYREISQSKVYRASDSGSSEEMFQERENGKTVRETAIRIHIQMFLEMLSTVDETTSEERWPVMLAGCLQALEFKQCHVAFDLHDLYPPAWYRQVILPFWEEVSLYWPGALHIVIGLPRDIYPFPPQAARYFLEWTNTELENLLNYRWEQTGSKQPLRSLFQGNAFDLLLLKAGGNPRYLLEMTHTLIGSAYSRFSDTNVIKPETIQNFSKYQGYLHE